MALGIIGIVVALAIFLYGAYKNVSVLYLAPLCGVIVAVTNGLNANDAFTSLYVGAVEQNAATGAWEIGGVCGMITAIFPTVFLGGKQIRYAGKQQRKTGKTCRFNYVTY